MRLVAAVATAAPGAPGAVAAVLLALAIASGCASRPAPPPVTASASAPSPVPATRTVSVDEEPAPSDLSVVGGQHAEGLASAISAVHQDWQFASYPGRLIVTPHYRIHTTIAAEPILERLPVFLEHALARYTTALADLPAPRHQVDTYVFRDRRQWQAKTRQLLPEQAGAFENLGRGGFTTRGISVLYYIDWAGRDRDTLAIAAHEGWHQYTQSTFRNPLPIWLEEGIATYMEGYRYRRNDDAPEFQPWRNWERGRALGDAMRKGHLIPLAELISDSPQSFLEDGKGRLLTYYAQVWALTRFLADGADGRYREALAETLADAADGRLIRRLLRSPAVLARSGRQPVLQRTRTGPWVILAYFTTDLTAFERDYLAYAERIAR